MLGPETVSEWLNVPLTTLYKWSSQGGGPAVARVGRHLRYRPADVRSWIEQHRGGRASEAPEVYGLYVGLDLRRLYSSAATAEPDRQSLIETYVRLEGRNRSDAERAIYVRRVAISTVPEERGLTVLLATKAGATHAR